MKPDSRQLHGELDHEILPLMQGTVRGERFVVSADMNSADLYVQFQGWIVEWPIDELLDESYQEIWGTSIDFDNDVDFDVGGSE